MAHLYPFLNDPAKAPKKAAIKRCIGEDGQGWVLLFPVHGDDRFDLVVVETTQFRAAVACFDLFCAATRRGIVDPRAHQAAAEEFLAQYDPLVFAIGGTVQ